MINVWKKLLISLGILVIICSTIFLLRNYSFVDEGTKENLVYEQKKIISNFKNCKSSPLKIKFPNYWKFPQKWNSIISKWDECFGEIIAEDQFYYSGGWKNGKKHFFGEWSNGNDSYIGGFKNDKFNGFGRKENLSCECITEEGLYENGKIKKSWF